jgi:hypothetical protein
MAVMVVMRFSQVKQVGKKGCSERLSSLLRHGLTGHPKVENSHTRPIGLPDKGEVTAEMSGET